MALIAKWTSECSTKSKKVDVIGSQFTAFDFQIELSIGKLPFHLHYCSIRLLGGASEYQIPRALQSQVVNLAQTHWHGCRFKLIPSKAISILPSRAVEFVV